MNTNQAVRIAVKCIELHRKQFSFDANLFKQGIPSFSGERAANEYDKLTEAIAVLESLAQPDKGITDLPLFEGVAR